MSAMWHYSDRRDQKGPVPFEELRRLAQAGYLRPSDLVWEAGSPQWVRASLVDGLFESAAPPLPPDWDEPAEPRPEPVRRRDDRSRTRDHDARRSAASRDDGLSTGLKVGLIVGGVVLLLTIIAVILIVVLSGRSRQATTYTVPLFAGQTDTRWYDFRAGQSVELHVASTTTGGFPPSVSVTVFDAGGFAPVASDAFGGRDSRLRFTVRATGRHRVVISNVGAGNVTSRVTLKY